MKALGLSLLLLWALPAAHAAPKLARTPPMGWNSWNRLRWDVSDKTVREIADVMVSSGMKSAGYTYVNIDDTWAGKRDAEGNLHGNEKFPDMKALADYVHGKGLKLGIYSSPGPLTRARHEGSYGHETRDAQTFAAWGIDYVKYDWASAGAVYRPSGMPEAYKKMGDALQRAGRPMVFSLSQYGKEDVWKWGAEAGGNLWRTTADIRDNWRSMSEIGFDRQTGLEKYAAPGHWNDPGMLVIGNGGMTAEEYRTQMSLWCILAAPLLASNDPRTMTPETLDILTNREAIAVDQDKLGKQGYRIAKNGDREVWAKPLADGAWAVGLFNRGSGASRIAVRWADLQLESGRKVRDLWAHEDRGVFPDGFSAMVASHGVVLIRVK